MIRFDRLPLFALLALPLLMGCPPKQPDALATSGDLSGSSADDGHGIADTGKITQEEINTLHENFSKVHFEFDRSELDDATRGVLSANAEILLRHRDVQVRVEGHADSYGSDIYNLALGQRRGDTVKGYLLDLGVPASQLSVISYGEERPLVDDMDRQKESPNRRAEFVVTAGSDKAASSY